VKVEAEIVFRYSLTGVIN